MIPLKTIEELISKHSLLEKELSEGNVDKKFFAEKSKEYSDLNDVIDDAKKYFSFEVEKKELEKILSDPDSDAEFKVMAETELKNLKIENEAIEKKLKLFLLPKDEADKKIELKKLKVAKEAWEEGYLLSNFLKFMKKLIIKKNGN